MRMKQQHWARRWRDFVVLFVCKLREIMITQTNAGLAFNTLHSGHWNLSKMQNVFFFSFLFISVVQSLSQRIWRIEIVDVERSLIMVRSTLECEETHTQKKISKNKWKHNEEQQKTHTHTHNTNAIGRVWKMGETRDGGRNVQSNKVDSMEIVRLESHVLCPRQNTHAIFRVAKLQPKLGLFQPQSTTVRRLSSLWIFVSFVAIFSFYSLVTLAHPPCSLWLASSTSSAAHKHTHIFGRAAVK